MVYRETDVAELFRDAPEVVFESIRTRGWLDTIQVLEDTPSGLTLEKHERVLEVENGVLTGLGRDKVITHDGKNYRIRTWRPVDPDGATLQIVVVPA